MAHYDLPPRLVFADVETTGFHSRDRVVSIGIVELDTAGLRRHRVEARCTHLIFDPGKKSHPRAEQVHGYDDWTLRHQDEFSLHAPALQGIFQDSSIVWAHNAEFDHAFLAREFLEAGLPVIGTFNCTMQLFRAQRPGERASLKAILQSMGIARAREDRHGALEDAWLAMLVYLNLVGIELRDVPTTALVPPTNLRAPPPLSGPLPRRSRRKKPELTSVVAETVRPAASRASEVLSLSRPLATLMMFVALADGEVTESEWVTIVELVDEISQRLGVTLSKVERHDIVASLLTPDGPPFSIKDAAAAVSQDKYSRENIARWIRAVTYADGHGSEAENRAIATITETLRSTMQAVGQADHQSEAAARPPSRR